MEALIAQLINPRDGAAPARAAPSALNGAAYTVDMAAAHQSVAVKNRVAIGVNGAFDLRRSMAYVLWVALGQPEAAVAANPEAVTSCMSRWGELINTHVLLSLLAHTNLAPNIAVRGSDVHTAGWFEARAAVFNALYPVVDRCYAAMDTDAVLGARHRGSARYCMWLLILNAWHREVNDGHNFFTDRVTAQRGEGARFVALAGASAGPFREWLISIGASGHDMWHFLTTSTLSTIAKIIVGEIDAFIVEDAHQVVEDAAGGGHGVPAPANGAGDGGGAGGDGDDERKGDGDGDGGAGRRRPEDAARGPAARRAGSYLFNGENVVGRTVNAVLQPGEAAQERYPPGTQGISVVHLGLEYLGIMVISMSAKVNVGNGGDFIASAEALTEALRARRLPRNEVVAVRDVMAPVIGISAGYLSKMAEYTDAVASAPSIRAFMDANKGMVARGIALHGVISQAQASAAAMNVAFVDSINMMVAAINRATGDVIAAGIRAAVDMPAAPGMVPNAPAVGIVVPNAANNIAP